MKSPAIALALLLTVFAQAEAPDPPNIIVVLCDDLGYGDVGANGATRIATPNIDRIAHEGLRLSAFYASANVCTPSRAGLLTGRYPIRLGLAKGVIFPHHKGGIADDEVTIAEVLREAGYRTGMIGKWHLGNQAPHWPTAQGFETFYGVPYSNDMKPFPLYRGETIIEEEVDQSTITERYSEEAVQFINRHKDERFFLYLPHTMPHIPLYVSPGFEGKSDASLYGDVVETIDHGIGRILQSLEDNGIDDNTLVIFTSDNGPWYEGSSGRYRDRKGASWEGGQRVPFFARWPGVIPAGLSSSAISMNIDLLPTLAKLAEAKLPEGRTIDGKDVSEVWLSGAPSPHEALYLFNEDKIAAIRTPQWKFVVETYYKSYKPTFRNENHFYHPGLLFDMQRDPEELYSVTRDQPEIVKAMNAYHDWAERELIQPNIDHDAR